MSPPTGFVEKPAGPVVFGEVREAGRLLGYVYTSAVEDALGFINVSSAGDFGGNVSMLWFDLFMFHWERKLKPAQAIREMEGGQSPGEGCGHLVPGSVVRTADSYAALASLAASS
ncbi:hypothetical protein [Frondihabitans peucedani]|uniref:hypothetical protein n=1 Tax=Frondihabitans peucedani TaxID=598626 RepID=UPI0031D97F9F